MPTDTLAAAGSERPARRRPIRTKRTPERREVCWQVVRSPIGSIGVAATERGACRLDLRCDAPRLVDELERIGLKPRRGGELVRPALEQLRRYLGGDGVDLDVPLDFLGGTAFQRSVWRALRSIPYGQTRPYAWVAARAGRKRAARAAGQAVGTNPIGILCPCHRVIRSDGSIGGFSAGLEIKRFLLRLEGINRFEPAPARALELDCW